MPVCHWLVELEGKEKIHGIGKCRLIIYITFIMGHIHHTSNSLHSIPIPIIIYYTSLPHNHHMGQPTTSSHSTTNHRTSHQIQLQPDTPHHTPVHLKILKTKVLAKLKLMPLFVCLCGLWEREIPQKNHTKIKKQGKLDFRFWESQIQYQTI